MIQIFCDINYNPWFTKRENFSQDVLTQLHVFYFNLYHSYLSDTITCILFQFYHSYLFNLLYKENVNTALTSEGIFNYLVHNTVCIFLNDHAVLGVTLIPGFVMLID